MKGLIPAAGKGTRMRPFTRAYPKELLPVGEKAVIEHAVTAMTNAGIEEIVVVVGWKQNAILDYLQSGSKYGANISYVVQDERNGLAGAVKAGEHVIDGESFAVVLGDNYLENENEVLYLKDFHDEMNFLATIGTFETNNPSSYGIVNPGENNRVKGLIEKPEEGQEPSNIGIAGTYILEPEIFEAIDQIERGAGDEYQLTDALDYLSQNKEVGYRKIKGGYIDVGTPERLRKANRELELRD